MAKPRRGETTKQGPKLPPPAEDFTMLPGVQPNPPRRRPLFLLAAAAAMALWLVFLAWMAVEASR